MCLRIEFSRFDDFPKPLIATEDLKVFKELNISNSHKYDANYAGRAPYRRKKVYRFGEIARANIARPSITRWGLYHSKGTFSFYEGLHSRTTSRCKLSDTKVFPAIIPKGSKYFIGDRHDIVSNQLKIVRLPKNKTLLQWRAGATPLRYKGYFA